MNSPSPHICAQLINILTNKYIIVFKSAPFPTVSHYFPIKCWSTSVNIAGSITRVLSMCIIYSTHVVGVGGFVRIIEICVYGIFVGFISANQISTRLLWIPKATRATVVSYICLEFKLLAAFRAHTSLAPNQITLFLAQTHICYVICCAY